MKRVLMTLAAVLALITLSACSDHGHSHDGDENHHEEKKQQHHDTIN